MKAPSAIRTLALAMIAPFAVATASAQTVNVMFTNAGSYAGASPVAGSTSDDQWNEISTYYDYFLLPYSSYLTDVNGNTTTYSFSVATPYGEFFLGGLGGNGVPVFNDYAHAGAAPAIDFTVTGLSANVSYDLYIYMGRNWGDSEDVQTGSATSGGDTLFTNYYGPQNDFINGTNYVVFSGVSANIDGELFFSVNNTPINGFTITPSIVPEPSAYAAIAGMLALGVVAARRRARR